MRRADIEVPNHPVDMDSWGRSACYPRGTFYPLSDTPSTRGCRITSPDFRPCSTCTSRSQAPLCTCTQHLIAVQVEGTFGRLRYFWRQPPQLNYPPGTVPEPDIRFEVRSPIRSEWYFNNDSTNTGVSVSQSPTYPTQTVTNSNTKL